jgi:RNA polymerase sigma factor (TIGR02999 family)
MGYEAMPERSPPDITGLLDAWNSGQPDALNRLVEAAYPELHRIAVRYLQGERSAHTLQCTALINEAYLRLVQAPRKQWNDRAHFFGFAARLMRGILVDYARARQTEKRGAGAQSITLSEADAAASGPDLDILDLNAALDELEKLDPFQSRVVELRYFGGLSIEETAEVACVSASTVKREWILAKTWIRRRLLDGRPQD